MSSVIFDDKLARWLPNQKFYHGYLPREDLPYVLKKKGDYIVRTTEVGRIRKHLRQSRFRESLRRSHGEIAS